MARRLEITPTTFSLWHAAETTSLAWLFVNDSSGNGRHLSNAGYASGSPSTTQKRDTPKVTNLVNAAGKGKRARGFSLDTNHQSVARTTTPGALAATFQGVYTAKVFLRVDSLALQRCIFAYSTDGETLASNTQFSWFVNATGYQEILTESGSGTNSVTTQSAGTAIGAGQVRMLHVVKTLTHYRFYVDGVFQQAIAIVTQPTGGTSAYPMMGCNLPTATVRFVGAMRSLMIRSVVETDAEILAQAALLGTASVDGTLQFTDSTNVAAHWVCDEAPDWIDACERGMHLCQSSVGGDITPGVTLMEADEVNAKYFSSASAEGIAVGVPDVNAIALQNLINTSDWSIVVAFRPGDGATGHHGLVLVAATVGPGSDLLTSENFMGFGLYNTNAFRYGHEWTDPVPPTVGIDEVASPTGVFTTGMLHSNNLAVVSFEQSTGKLRIWINVTLVSETTLGHAPGVGSSAFMRLGNGTLDTTWFGNLGTAKIDGRVWTQDDVDEAYEVLFGAGALPDDGGSGGSSVAPATYMGLGTGGLGFQVD